MNIEEVGDRGIRLHFNEYPSPELTKRLIAISASASGIEGVVDATPGHQTILLEVVPEARSRVKASVENLNAEIATAVGRAWQLPCTYDGEDLHWMSQHLEMEVKEIVRRHSERLYTVMVIGSPGFVYLSEVDPGIRVPRLPEPRLQVPRGSVGIGGKQGGIYGRARPGGWRIIGRVEMVPELSPGDTVEFIPK